MREIIGLTFGELELILSGVPFEAFTVRAPVQENIVTVALNPNKGCRGLGPNAVNYWILQERLSRSSVQHSRLKEKVKLT